MVPKKIVFSSEGPFIAERAATSSDRTQSSASTLNRPSDVSKARLKAYELATHNHEAADTVREESEMHRDKRQEDREDVATRARSRVKANKALREQTTEAVMEAVREQWSAKAAGGREFKEAREEQLRAGGMAREASFNRHKSDAYLQHKMQQERTALSREEKHEELRLAAQAAKADIASKREACQQRSSRALQERRQRVAAIKAATAPEIMQDAKAGFSYARKSAADGVRAQVQRWSAVKQSNHEQCLRQAHVHRAAAYATRGSANGAQAALVAQRRREAAEMRRALYEGELASQAALGLLSSEAREAHDLLYEAAFASADEAERVERSPIDRLRQASRPSPRPSPRLKSGQSPSTAGGPKQLPARPWGIQRRKSWWDKSLWQHPGLEEEDEEA